MVRRRAALGALLLAGVAAPVAAVAVFAFDHDSGKKTPGLQPRLNAIVDSGAPGVIVLARDGARRSSLTSGLADPAAHARMRTSDRFRIGSVTKTFVATVVLQLVAEGRVGLDDPVERWLRESHYEWTANHDRAAARPQIGPLRLYGRPARVPAVLDAPAVCVDAATPDRARGVPPGRFQSSWFAIRVLEHELSRFGADGRARHGNERWAGSYETPVPPARPPGHELPPGALAGARRCTRFSRLVTRRDRLCRCHCHRHGCVQRIVDVGSRGIVSSADDLARFFAALLGGRVLRPDLLRAMETTPPPRRYGLGLALFRTPCGPASGDTGNVLGYVTAVWNTKDGRRQVVLAVNSYPFSAATDRPSAGLSCPPSAAERAELIAGQAPVRAV